MSSNLQKACIVYCRVSAAKSAQQGESLDTQDGICRRFVEGRGWKILPEDRVFRETFTGRKDERPVLEEALDYIRQNPGRVDYFVFRVIDRFTRGGSYAYEGLKKELTKYGVTMVDTYGVIQPTMNTLEPYGFEYEWSKTSPSEMAEIVIANTAKAEITNSLTRMIGREIELTQQGYKIRQAADGFSNKRIYVDGKKRVVQVPDPERAPFYIEMFKLRAAGALSDKQIVERVNAQGFRTRVHNRWNKSHEKVIGRTGGVPLTVKRLQETIIRPIYCGVLCEKWTHGMPIKAKFDGLVSIDMFNQANRGKVFIKNSAGALQILKNYHPESGKRTHSRENPLFPYKNIVLCPECRRPFTGSCPRGRSGIPFPTYHCSRNHKYIGIPKEKFDGTVERYARNLNFNLRTFDMVSNIILDRYHERKKEVANAVLKAQEAISELRALQKMKGEAFVVATSPVLRAQLEREIDDLEGQIKAASGEHHKLDLSVNEIEEFRALGKECLEHPAESFLNSANTTQQTGVYGLLFEELPTYAEMLDGTAKLSWICRAVSGSADAKSVCVHTAGLSWNTIEYTIKQWIATLTHFFPSNKRRIHLAHNPSS